jgi:hypothetical protein
MSNSRDQESRSWDQEEAAGEGLVGEMKRPIQRQREQFSDYHASDGDNDNGDDLTPAD